MTGVSLPKAYLQYKVLIRALAVFICLILLVNPIHAESRSMQMDITKPIEQTDWKFFLDSTQTWRAKLWEFYTYQGKKLSDWSWTWRLAWIRVCHLDHSNWCSDIMEDSLKDKAMVVRSKAAKLWGRRYLGTKDTKAGLKLSKVYHLRENDRHGKPMFVKKSILSALKDIGGEKNLQLGKKLSATQDLMKHYWNSL